MRQGDKPEWVERLFHWANLNIPKEFVGQIEINAFKGGVSNINVRQSYKEDATR